MKGVDSQMYNTSIHIIESPEAQISLSEEKTDPIDRKYRILDIAVLGKGYTYIFLTTEQAGIMRDKIDEALYDESETTKGLKEKIDALESENNSLYEEINRLEYEISLME